jgi:hypothetical protein
MGYFNDFDKFLLSVQFAAKWDSLHRAKVFFLSILSRSCIADNISKLIEKGKAEI